MLKQQTIKNLVLKMAFQVANITFGWREMLGSSFMKQKLVLSSALQDLKCRIQGLQKFREACKDASCGRALGFN